METTRPLTVTAVCRPRQVVSRVLCPACCAASATSSTAAARSVGTGTLSVLDFAMEKG